jgi:nitrate/nitrite transport system ATP-binding protein
VDEGIVVADRIIPLSAGPRATLGPSVRVDIERPRDRRALNHDPRFKAIRKEVIEFLLGRGGRQPTSAAARERVLPDLDPEDLSAPRAIGGWRRGPDRRNEIKHV